MNTKRINPGAPNPVALPWYIYQVVKERPEDLGLEVAN
jgi:hypothetical protein